MDNAVSRWRGWALLLAGPALVGAGLGIPEGPEALLLRAALLPIVVLGVTLLMTPALYIGAAFVGVPKGVHEIGAAVRESLTEMGIVLAGAAPALAFLVAASSAPASLRFLGYATLLLGVSIGLRALFVRVRGEGRPAVAPLFVGWAAVCVGIGARLVGDVMAL